MDAFGFGVVDHFAEVPAEGVDGLDLAGVGAGGLGDVLGVVADAFEVAARFGAAEVAAVVVAHLQEEIVAGLHLGEGGGPVAFVDVGARGAAGDGSVGDVDARGVEELREVVAPAEVGAVARGGVADDEDRGERGVEWSVVRDVGLRRCGRRSLLGDGVEAEGE